MLNQSLFPWAYRIVCMYEEVFRNSKIDSGTNCGCSIFSKYPPVHLTWLFMLLNQWNNCKFSKSHFMSPGVGEQLIQGVLIPKNLSYTLPKELHVLAALTCVSRLGRHGASSTFCIFSAAYRTVRSPARLLTLMMLSLTPPPLHPSMHSQQSVNVTPVL